MRVKFITFCGQQLLLMFHVSLFETPFKKKIKGRKKAMLFEFKLHGQKNDNAMEVDNVFSVKNLKGIIIIK